MGNLWEKYCIENYEIATRIYTLTCHEFVLIADVVWPSATPENRPSAPCSCNRNEKTTLSFG